MELVTKEYLEDNIKTYDTYRGLDKIGAANGIATLDANGLVTWSQIPQLGDPNGIATLDSNGTVPASQLDLTSVVTVTPSITSSDTGAYSVGSVTVNNTTVDLYGRDTPVTVTPSITSSDTGAYSVGSVTVNNTTVDLYGRDTPVTVTPGSIQSTDPDAYLAGTIVANGTTTELYGKDTTYQVATDSVAGLVKLGTGTRATGTLDSTNDWYPVTIDNNGKMYVQVQAQHKWKALYPNDQFQVTITNVSGDYRGIKIILPSCILFAQFSYTSCLGTDTSVTTLMKYKGAGSYIGLGIGADTKVINSKAINYIFIKCITEKGTIDVTLSIDVRGKDTTFNADIV